MRKVRKNIEKPKHFTGELHKRANMQRVVDELGKIPEQKVNQANAGK